MKNLLFCLVVFFLLISCENDDEYTEMNNPMQFVIPSNFPDLAQDISQNYPTEKGFELGRKLFYDGKLSKDGTISCSFCHEQASAFTHHGHDFSHGINDLVGIRNAPAIQNVAFQSEYFYDGASNSIEMLSLAPIHNPVEMDETMERIVEKLKKEKTYQKLFRATFDSEKITTGMVLKALGQFMTVMISANSRYDKFVRQEEGGTLTAIEKQGMLLFENKCSMCHQTDLFTDNSFRNNGLPPNPNLNDLGRETVTGFSSDRYKFKVPSLRNVELTAPYMHDGRFGSLESVLDFYRFGMVQTPTLDSHLNENGVIGIAISEEEKKALIAFLKTLTDDEYVHNPLFYYKT